MALIPLDSSPAHRLGEWGTTAICGNDIMSSCLYVAALATIYGGRYAPLCLLLVGGVLYLYRWIYAEVGDALPLNGGVSDLRHAVADEHSQGVPLRPARRLQPVPVLNRKLSRAIIQRINTINEVRFVFFTRGDSRKSLNDVMLYVRDNEQTKRLRVVLVYENEREIPAGLANDLDFLDEVYPEIDVEFVTVRGRFTPGLIERLSREWGIPKNYMFIGSPSGRFPYRIAELGGVRLIV